MNAPKSSFRRAVVSASALLPLAANTLTSLAAPRGGGTTLVAYFSRTGNTRVIAGQIQRVRGATLFEIKPAAPYPEDYERTVAQFSCMTTFTLLSARYCSNVGPGKK
jgi:hypothetical protein